MFRRSFLHLRPVRSCVAHRGSNVSVQRLMSTEGAEGTPNAKNTYQLKKRKFGLGTAILCTIPFITFGLGTWQVQRLRWKHSLIERLEERMFLDPVPLPRRISATTMDDYEYRRVEVVGTFQHDQEMLVGPRTRGDGVVGYFLVTPLVREDGSRVLIKRGWVSNAKKEQSSRPESLVQGPVKVEGLMRLTEQPNSFTPDNVPEKNQWYWIDLDTMANLTYSQPLMVESVSDKPSYHDKLLIDQGVPIGRSPVVEVRNSHLQYIVTWYSLSLATTAMLWVLLRRKNLPTNIKKRP
ncbi:SURF1-domain-containing protein [Hesseltinella vesiculosa]|uniref:SURF1-like protein n=1 Tax=Hesseltinella vesiculosa TaxID=101127 RepID=A0A1X2GNJ7_9FUNG|nr:SURF1-domain-containing protein [Hesseltinella vesiculosa]